MPTKKGTLEATKNILYMITEPSDIPKLGVNCYALAVASHSSKMPNMYNV